MRCSLLSGPRLGPRCSLKNRVRHIMNTILCKKKKIKMATSFKKKGSRGRAVYPPGTRPSLHNSQLLISSGVPSMDNVVGEFIRFENA